MAAAADERWPLVVGGTAGVVPQAVDADGADEQAGVDEAVEEAETEAPDATGDRVIGQHEGDVQQIHGDHSYEQQHAQRTRRSLKH